MNFKLIFVEKDSSHFLKEIVILEMQKNFKNSQHIKNNIINSKSVKCHNIPLCRSLKSFQCNSKRHLKETAEVNFEEFHDTQVNKLSKKQIGQSNLQGEKGPSHFSKIYEPSYAKKLQKWKILEK